jgi:hypothetical protein
VKDGVSLGGLVRPGLIWLVLFLGTNAFLFGSSLVRALNVMRNRETIAGTITELPPRRPAVASYEINGQSYTTETGCPECLSIPTLGQLRVGDRVTIEYNPDAPKYGIPGSAKKLLLSDMKDIAFIGVFLIFAAAYFEFNIRKSSRKSHTE